MFFLYVLQNVDLLGLHIIQKGTVKISYEKDLVKITNASSLVSENQEYDLVQNNRIISVKKPEGSYFGEWTLLGEQISSLKITAVGEVVCAVLTKEKFDLVAGPLEKLPQDYNKYVLILFTIRS